MLPESYKKLIVSKIGSNPHECLKIVEVPLKKLHAHEILVKNHFAGINAIDVGRMMGLDGWTQAPPFDFGIEALGEVVAVGDKVEEFKPGHQVVTALPGNGYSEYSIIDRNFTGKVPALNPKYVGVYISGAIAKIALEIVADMQANETVMVTSGLGASGHFAVQLAKIQGCHVVATCANDEEAELLQNLGTDRVINRSREDVYQVLQDEYHDMLNVVFDDRGGKILDACIEHTAPRARVVLIEALREHLYGESPQHNLDLYRKVIRRSVSLIGFNAGDYANAIPIESFKLLDKVEMGVIQSIVDPTNFEGLAAIPDAIQHLMGGTSQGKIVVKL